MSRKTKSTSARHQPRPYLRRFVPSLLFVASVTCCLRMLSSSALRSRPGQAQILASKQRRPKTWPLGDKDILCQKQSTANEGGRRRWRRRSLLSGFQGDDDENRASVHSAHAARVAHEIVQNGGEFGPHLRRRMRLQVSDGGRRKNRGRIWTYFRFGSFKLV